MLKLDNSLLDELGLGGLPADQKQAMLQHIYDTLELRVGTNLANQMTEAQLQEFEKFIDSSDTSQAQALQWLEANLPHYKQVVNDVFEVLKAEIKQMAPQIMASSVPQQSAAQPVAQPIVVDPRQPYDTPQTVNWAAPQQQQDTTSAYQSPMPQQQPIQPQQGQNVYQAPLQQPPAGPGNYQPPYYPDQQRPA